MKRILSLRGGRALATLLGLLLGFLVPLVQAQTASPAWQKAITVGQAKGIDIKLEAIAADTIGHVYVTGSFTGTAHFGSTALTAGAGGLTFVAKWDDVAQRYCWAVPVAAASAVTLYDLAASGGSVYGIGSYERPVRLGDTTLTETGGAFFIAKLVDRGTTGQLVWAQPLVAESGEGVVPRKLAVRGAAVYVAGEFKGTVRLGSTNLRSNENRSLFIAKLLDTGGRGRFVWARQSGGSGSATNPTLAVAGARVYVTGGYTGTVTFGADSVGCPPQETRMLVAKLLDTGPTATVGWIKRLEIGQGNVDAMVAAGDSLYIAADIDRNVQMHKTDTYPTLLQRLCIAKLRDEGATSQVVWKTQFDNAQPTDNVNVMSMTLHGSALYLAGQV